MELDPTDLRCPKCRQSELRDEEHEKRETERAKELAVTDEAQHEKMRNTWRK